MKLLRADELDFARLVRPGDHVVSAQATGEPLTLTRRLVAQRAAIGPFSWFAGPAYSDTFPPDGTDGIAFRSYGAIGRHIELSRAGRLEIVPSHYSALDAQFASGLQPADVVLIQLAPPPPGREGWSLSLTNDFAVSAARNARLLVAEVNPDAPWTHGASLPDGIEPHILVAAEAPPQEMPASRFGEVETAIAAHIATLIPDGACLQFGVGAIPTAALSGLLGHRDLGIHSGVITDGCLDLIEAGVITNARKGFEPGVSVTNALLGTKRLFRHAHDNPAIRVSPPSHTHAGAIIARQRDFRAINSAVEVDLTGSVNAEVAGGAYVGAVGGQQDFVRGAWAAQGGRSIIALPATARGGSTSRIVARAGTVTVPRSDADLIVTEYGIADLRGASLPERARRMLAIAAPQFREDLDRAWRGGGG